MKSFFVIILFWFHSFYVNANQCHTYYSSKLVMENTPLGLVERFQIYSSRNPGFFNLVVSNFLDLQVESLIKDYSEQIKLLERVGTDSSLKSNLGLIDLSYKEASEKLTLVGELSNPSTLRKIFNFSSGLQQKLKSAVTEFQICKGKFEVCYTDLKAAVDETSSHQVKLEKLITRIKRYQKELSFFIDFLKENYSSLGISEPIYISAEPIISSHASRINEMLILSEKVLLTEAQNITVAIFNLKNLAPLLNQRVKETIQKGAPNELNENYKPIDNQTKFINELKTVLELKFEPNAILKIIEKNVNQMDSISFEEALFILKNVPLGVNWGYKIEKGKRGENILYQNLQTSWSGFVNTELLIAYRLLMIVKTEKTTNTKLIKQFVDRVNKILQQNLKDKNDKYIVEVHQAFAPYFAVLLNDNK